MESDAQSDRDARRVYWNMWAVMSLLAAGVIGCGVSGVYLLAHGHWWALGPLALLLSVVYGVWWLFGMYDTPDPVAPPRD